MHHDGQTVLALAHEGTRRLVLPPAASAVLPGVPWGAYEQLFTPAFWAARAFLEEGALGNYRLGRTLREEVVACLLGGYGIPADVGLLAFTRLRDAGALETLETPSRIYELLSMPLDRGGRSVRYRFAAQKARYVAAALGRLVDMPEPPGDRELRDALCELPGVGHKTASWITRNWRGSDQVAILDVHVCRACELADVFPSGQDPSKDYLRLEARFLEFAQAISVRASMLDNLVWQTMRRVPPAMVRRARDRRASLGKRGHPS